MIKNILAFEHHIEITLCHTVNTTIEDFIDKQYISVWVLFGIQYYGSNITGQDRCVCVCVRVCVWWLYGVAVLTEDKLPHVIISRPYIVVGWEGGGGGA